MQENENNEDGTQNEDTRVSVIEAATGRTLTGDEAPLMSQLSSFLEAHPGWEPIESDSDEEDEEEDGDDDNEDKGT